MAEKPGKYGDLIRQARQPESQSSGKPDDQITSQPDDQIAGKPEGQEASQPDERMVNLCVKVPESLRRYWAAQSKLTGVTMTDVIVDALTQKFGKPDDQKTR